MWIRDSDWAPELNIYSTISSCQDRQMLASLLFNKIFFCFMPKSYKNVMF